MKINFKQFKAYTSLKGEQYSTTDAREHVANCVYMSGTGVYAHNLALKILNSDGEMELEPRDEQTVAQALADKGLSFVYASFVKEMKKQQQTINQEEA